ncbi:MAG: CDC48 family AAA ATPase [Nanobdellota archaeon]
MEELRLKVAEAVQDDVNKGIVRLDSNFILQLGLKTGDIVEIEGERKTVSIIDRAYPGDIGLKIVRMDGLTRRNARTGIGEYVTIKKAEVKEASKLVVAPAQKGIAVRAPSSIFRQGLLGRAAIKGDIVGLGGTRRRRQTMSDSPLFNEIFNIMNENVSGFGLGDLKFVVAESSPKGPVIITENTEVEFNPTAVDVEEEAPSADVSYEDIGGMDEETRKIREMVELPLKHPELFEQLGIEPPKGVLLHGPPGTGKTLLAKAVANETNSNFTVINGPEIMSKFYGESEANLRKIFEDAEKNAPSIIFIDEIDAIAGNREESKGEVERRVVAQLLSIMDGLKSRGKVVVIAATNIVNSLDPALRRPGRFDRELEIAPPNKEGRHTILKIHTRYMPISPSKDLDQSIQSLNKKISKLNDDVKNIKSTEKASKEAFLKDRENEIKQANETLEKIKKMKKEEFKNAMNSDNKELLDNEQKSIINKVLLANLLEEIAETTHGFVGADLASLARETAMVVLRRVLPDLNLDEDKEIPQEVLSELKITKKDFYDALKFVRPSALREVLVEVPDVKWNKVGGLDKAKQQLKEAVEWPLKNPLSFRNLGIKPPRGILLYGPPGTGKTLLAKAVANESQANFISIKGPELLSKWVGESEKAVRDIFKKARQTSPSIIFFDEIDSLVPRRSSVENDSSRAADSVVNQLLTEIDGVEDLDDVIIVGATNRPDRLDPALLRPGRFDRMILIDAPDKKTREDILKIHTAGMKLKDVKLSEIADKLEGYVGADIESVVKEAGIRALRENIDAKHVEPKHFEEAIKNVKPSVTEDIKKAYESLQDKFSKAKGKEMAKEQVNYFG